MILMDAFMMMVFQRIIYPGDRFLLPA